eukprot:CAMPEP_0177554200 /NCGR_PEP_ID=MMETSP0369-20130122/67842_1 /TAXON_ID=447022 ORGANISM="Scrippsiella hangoei-like, Strain SHHI-4" /NCGR_SAMPLE_ID=MMETSP0369 /ASSEMBLY_ACC=CAM_ASM_000364 /LENGTH=60 /DNA_ID=CAMNT_0019040179 /DNA_START=58 /DNA_END=237 /DNA_ORIENTATION=-
MSAASRGLDSEAPPPTNVCASSTKSTASESSISASTALSLSSKSPRKRVPAVSAPTSKAW